MALFHQLLFSALEKLSTMAPWSHLILFFLKTFESVDSKHDFFTFDLFDDHY